MPEKVLVVGLARSGVAAVNLLLSRGASVRVTDLKAPEQLGSELSRLEGPVELELGRHRREDFLSADLVVVSPGVAADIEPLREARAAGVRILPEVELASSFLAGPLIGVTGSNGKTTTVTLIGRMFEEAGRGVSVAGNIGMPLSRIALSEPGPELTAVVELSSFQLELTERFRAHIALVLNVTPDHLDRHGGLEAYAAAKQRILLNQEPGDWAVLNADNELSLRMRRVASGQLCLFSRRPLREGVSVEEGWIVFRHQGAARRVLPVSEIALKGEHNLENVLAATCAACLSGISPNPIRSAVRDFRGVEHRLEPVAVHDGVAYYNDSKATNVESARKALLAFPGPVVLIMGGLDKGGDFETLTDVVRERVRKLILIGAASGKIAGALGSSTRVCRAADMREAVGLAGAAAREGDTVLLAPGCASFDMFDDYEHRGREFKACVARFVQGRGLQN